MNADETKAPFEIYPVHPDLLLYAKQTTDFAEIEREIEEMLRTGSGIPRRSDRSPRSANAHRLISPLTDLSFRPIPSIP
jgi:hypothetical protein